MFISHVSIGRRLSSLISNSFGSRLMASFDVLSWREGTYGNEEFIVDLKPPIPTGAYWSKESSLLGGHYHFGDRSGLLPYKPCPLPCSLSEGFPERFVQKPGTESPGVEVILKALNTAKVDYSKFHLITFRNNLNKISTTLVDLKKPWVIDVCCLTKSPQTIFLDIQSSGNEETFPDSERFSYFGYHFEHLSTDQKEEEMVDSTSEFAVIVESKLNQKSWAIAGEVDCYDPNLGSADLELDSLIELKTSKVPENERKQLNAQRFKFPKWWFQSMIVGVPKVVVGYWKDDGELINVKTFLTKDLPALAAEGIPRRMLNQLWSPKELLGFLNAVVEWMRSVVQNERDQQFRFSFVPERRLISACVIPNGDMVERINRTLIGKE